MIQEKEIHNCNSVGNFGGRSSSKKQKHKKQPQRGLGVAQLEKIRLEEQKKRDGKYQSYSRLIPIRPDHMRATLTGARVTDPLCATIDREPAFSYGFGFFYGSNHIVPVPGLIQRPQRYHQQQPSSSSPSIGNGSSSANSSCSLLNFHMEPPSNQSSNANYSPFWPNEEKTVGMKRPYWFSGDNPQGTSLPYRLPAILHPLSRSGEPPLFVKQGSSSCSNSDSRRSISQNGEFLKLAPTTTTEASPISKIKGYFPYVPPFNIYQTFEFDSLVSHQGSMENATLKQGNGLRDQEQQPYCYSFLPTSMLQANQTKKSISSLKNGGVAENIDLNLKL